MMKIEVITQNAQETIQAERCGVDRVELVSAMEEGGLTPNGHTLQSVLKSTSIPVHIMVRPHSDHFIYGEEEWKTIKQDLSMIDSLGGRKIVFGCLTAEGTIDETLLKKVIANVPTFEITFHRAFDRVSSQIDAYKTLTAYKTYVKRILTSGGKDTSVEAISQLQTLVQLSKTLNGPTILVGSGLTATNIQFIHQHVRATEYHFGSGVRCKGDVKKPLSSEKIKAIRNHLKI